MHLNNAIPKAGCFIGINKKRAMLYAKKDGILLYSYDKPFR